MGAASFRTVDFEAGKTGKVKDSFVLVGREKQVEGAYGM